MVDRDFRVSAPMAALRETTTRTRMAAAVVIAVAAGTAQAQNLPAGFTATIEASGFSRPVGAAFAADGRMFVWEQRGVVWVVVDGVTLPEPFVDLREEVNGNWDRGLLGLALDPDYMDNHQVYVLYTVDPVYGEPDEPADMSTFQRLVRYTGTEASAGNVADPKSRFILIGETRPEGILTCEPSHAIGTLAFGTDGSLFATTGDGASYEKVDDGGYDPDAFGAGGFPIEEDIGAYRSQYLGSLSGKILRVDPATGLGLPDNPYFDGDATSRPSRVWAYGVRNPWRATVRPGSPAPGTVYSGEVGWNWFEELNIARGGENFGWPCYSGSGPAQDYPKSGHPAHSGCETIETPENPGPLTPAAAWYHHVNGAYSNPVGSAARALMAGAFYVGDCYPESMRGALFFADYSKAWLKIMRVDADDNVLGIDDFATGLDRAVGAAVHPITGDLHVVELNLGTVKSIQYAPAGDIDEDCQVGVTDLLQLLAAWGDCAGCPEDLDGDGMVGVSDLLLVLGSWG